MLLAHPRVIQQLADYSLYWWWKTHQATNSDINVHIKKNAIKRIASNTVKDISKEDYVPISAIEKYAESGY